VVAAAVVVVVIVVVVVVVVVAATTIIRSRFIFVLYFIFLYLNLMSPVLAYRILSLTWCVREFATWYPEQDS